MTRGPNDWESTYDLAGNLYCSCGAMYHAVKYRWRGEKRLYCSATCLMVDSLREEMVGHPQNDTSMHVAGGTHVD